MGEWLRGGGGRGSRCGWVGWRVSSVYRGIAGCFELGDEAIRDAACLLAVWTRALPKSKPKASSLSSPPLAHTCKGHAPPPPSSPLFSCPLVCAGWGGRVDEVGERPAGEPPTVTHPHAFLIMAAQACMHPRRQTNPRISIPPHPPIHHTHTAPPTHRVSMSAAAATTYWRIAGLTYLQVSLFLHPPTHPHPTCIHPSFPSSFLPTLTHTTHHNQNSTRARLPVSFARRSR